MSESVHIHRTLIRARIDSTVSRIETFTSILSKPKKERLVPLDDWEINQIIKEEKQTLAILCVFKNAMDGLQANELIVDIKA